VPDVKGGIPAARHGGDISVAVKMKGRVLADDRFFPPGWKPGSTAGKDARRYTASVLPALRILKTRHGLFSSHIFV